MNDKREVATVVLYRNRGDNLEFFIQKRDADAKSAPDKLGLFGGGLEVGESIDQALGRELQEELEYTPTSPVYFSRYEHATHINHIFLEQVAAGFENKVVVHEGQYGKFLTYDEIVARGDAMLNTLYILAQVSKYLTTK